MTKIFAGLRPAPRHLATSHRSLLADAVSLAGHAPWTQPAIGQESYRRVKVKTGDGRTDGHSGRSRVDMHMHRMDMRWGGASGAHRHEISAHTGQEPTAGQQPDRNALCERPPSTISSAASHTTHRPRHRAHYALTAGCAAPARRGPPCAWGRPSCRSSRPAYRRR